MLMKVRSVETVQWIVLYFDHHDVNNRKRCTGKPFLSISCKSGLLTVKKYCPRSQIFIFYLYVLWSQTKFAQNRDLELVQPTNNVMYLKCFFFLFIFSVYISWLVFSVKSNFRWVKRQNLYHFSEARNLSYFVKESHFRTFHLSFFTVCTRKFCFLL